MLKREEFESSAGCRELVKELAEKDFANHVITKVADERWLCRNPGSSSYWFFVIVVPGTVIIYGDVGECILQMYERSTLATLAWIRGSCDSWDYVLGKMHRPPKTFFPGDAIAYLEDMVKNEEEENAEDDNGEPVELADRKPAASRPILEEAIDLAKCGELNQHTWGGICGENNFEGEVYGVPEKWDSDCYWSIHALRTFIRLHDLERDKPDVEKNNGVDTAK